MQHTPFFLWVESVLRLRNAGPRIRRICIVRTKSLETTARNRLAELVLNNLKALFDFSSGWHTQRPLGARDTFDRDVAGTPDVSAKLNLTTATVYPAAASKE